MNPLVFEMIAMEFCRATATEKRRGGGAVHPKRTCQKQKNYIQTSNQELSPLVFFKLREAEMTKPPLLFFDAFVPSFSPSCSAMCGVAPCVCCGVMCV